MIFEKFLQKAARASISTMGAPREILNRSSQGGEAFFAVLCEMRSRILVRTQKGVGKDLKQASDHRPSIGGSIPEGMSPNVSPHTGLEFKGCFFDISMVLL